MQQSKNPLQWTTASPSNAVVSQIAADPQTAGTLYAVSGGYICRTTDGGRHWSILNLQDPLVFPHIQYNGGVSMIAVDPTHGSRLFIGGGFTVEVSAGVFVGRGVFVSEDGGASWQPRGLHGVRRIWIDPSQPSTLYADDAEGFFRTLDGGLNWTPLNLPGTTHSYPSFAFAVGSDGTAFVWFPSAGVFRSRDRGESWAPTSPSSPPFSNVRAIVVDPTSATTLYVLAQEGLFRSADQGGSWEQRGGGSPMSLTIDPRNAAVLYAGGIGGVWRSADTGKTWQPIGVHPPFSATAAVVALTVDPQVPTTIYSGTQNSSGDFERGFYWSEDEGATWSHSNKGLPGVTVVALLPDPSSPAVVYAATGGGGTASVYKSRDSGANWEKTGPPDLPSIRTLAIDPVTPTTLYVGTADCPSRYGSWQCEGEVRKSTDGGLSWAKLFDYGGIRTLAVDPTNPKRIFLSTFCVNLDLGPCAPPLQSGDGGVTWGNLAYPPGTVQQFLFDPMVRDTVYALALHLSATGVFTATVYKSTDGGASWTPASSGLPTTQGVSALAPISKLVLDAKSPGTLYAATRKGLFRTRDGGASWSVTGLSQVVKDLAIDPWNSDVLYAATEGSETGGVQRSLDGGSTWQPINDGFPNLSAEEIVIDSAGDVLHATTILNALESGVYELKLPRRIQEVESPHAPRVVKPRT